MSNAQLQRVEKHSVKCAGPYFLLLKDFCHKAKNLYNHANYLVRQAFFTEKKWIRCAELDRLLKADGEYPDYADMPTAQSARQILRLLDKNWKSFFSSIKEKTGRNIRKNIQESRERRNIYQKTGILIDSDQPELQIERRTDSLSQNIQRLQHFP